MRKRNGAWLLMSLLFFASIQGKGQDNPILVDTNVSVIDAFNAPFDSVEPGDTIFLLPGPRRYLLIRHLHGEPSNPIVITNTGGPTSISTDHYFGISIQDCSHFRMTGTGDPGTFYGIRIDRVARGGGLGVGFGSSDFELDHLSVMNCLASGIVAKTEPTCSSGTWRNEFTQFNTVIHDNYIANVENEGMYIGSSKYLGQSVTCNGEELVVLPPLLLGVRIYNNIVENTGMDAIQVGSASDDCLVYDNYVSKDGQREMFAQMSGITIGGGSRCDCYNNRIEEGKGNGIEIHGLGGMRVFNNIIINPGRSFKPDEVSDMRYGIYVSDVTAMEDSSFTLVYNTIISPKSDGIRFNSLHSSQNRIIANAIINPGNYDLYETDNTSYVGEDAYVMIQNMAIDVTLESNYFSRDIDSAGLDRSTYAPLPGSVLIDALQGAGLGINFDKYYQLRPVGTGFDIGAVEFNPATIGIQNDQKEKPATLVYPNPAGSQIVFRLNDLENGDVMLQIYNGSGKLLVKKTCESKNNSVHYHVVNLQNFNPGLYFYSITGNRRSESGTFIKK